MRYRRRASRTLDWPRRLSVAAALAATAGACTHEPRTPDAEIVELTAVDLAARIGARELSAERVTAAFLERIATLDDAGPTLGAVIEVNPDALAIARSLDARLAAGGVPVGPLHGVPVLLKANIDTGDSLATSAGSVALAAHHARQDAPLVAQLRAAGAVILGKTNLSEWANFRATDSTSGWSSLGGQTRNAYVLDRNPCGSSSGSAVAVAARFAPLAVGTETDGSIVCPASANGVVGVKPSVGSVSGAGIVPIAKSQDTAGPLARKVRDAALLLQVLQQSSAGETRAPYSFTRSSLRGLRIGVVRDFAGAGVEPATEAAYAEALELLRNAGAELVDPVAVRLTADVNDAELQVLLHEFRVELNDYLTRVESGPSSLTELIDFNEANAATAMPFFGQDLLLAAQQTAGLDALPYRDALATIAAFRARLSALFAEQRLDLLVSPANARAWRTDWAAGDRFSVGSSAIAAITGFPNVTVPIALARELPLGLSLIGPPDAEALLLEVAAVVEDARGEFPAPRFLPNVPD